VLKQWPEVAVTVTSPLLTFEEYYPYEVKTKEELIQLLVGDTQRVRRYAELGYQEPQEMPSEVWSACLELASRGYNRYWLPEVS